MARPKPDVELVQVLLRLHPDVIAIIDKLRGEASRAAWIGSCIGRDLGERSERAAEVKAARKAAKATVVVVHNTDRLTIADVRAPFVPRLKKGK